MDTQSEEYVAVYDYEAAKEGELSFKKGEKLQVDEHVSADWWHGTTESGKEGIFPSNYVMSVKEHNNRLTVKQTKQIDITFQKGRYSSAICQSCV